MPAFAIVFEALGITFSAVDQGQILRIFTDKYLVPISDAETIRASL